MEVKTLKDLKQGDYFRKVNKQDEMEKTVYVKGGYVRSLKKFSVCKFKT